VAELQCDTDTIWNHSGEDDVLRRFHEAARDGRLGPAANGWYADFMRILASLHRQPSAR